MQHHSQGLDKGPTTGAARILASHRVISAAEIEHHINTGKRLQSQAIADLIKTGLNRLAGLGHVRPHRGERLSRA